MRDAELCGQTLHGGGFAPRLRPQAVIDRHRDEPRRRLAPLLPARREIQQGGRIGAARDRQYECGFRRERREEGINLGVAQRYIAARATRQGAWIVDFTHIGMRRDGVRKACKFSGSRASRQDARLRRHARAAP
jgi:hypothetical protein